MNATCLVLLMVYVGASFGFIPSPQVIASWLGKLSADRYPCEECGCGCASARECWTHCCCHTEHERLVWAIENGVMPPEFVDFSDEQWIAAANAVQAGSAHCSLCVISLKDRLRHGIATKAMTTSACHEACGGTCGKSPCRTCDRAPGAPAPCCSNPPRSKATGPFMSALSCKGVKQMLLFSLPPVPPVHSITWTLPEPVPFVPMRPKEMACTSRALEVPEPPPRA